MLRINFTLCYEEIVTVFRLLFCLLVCCAILSACQAPTPGPSLLTLRVEVASDGWQVWQVGSSPNAVLGLVTQGDRLWAGTRFGVWQIDPATRRVLRHDLQLWLVSERGIAIYDPKLDKQP
jgi:hypothetical protein